MRILAKLLVMAYLASATGSSAQSTSAPSSAPTSVNEVGTLTQPLAGTLFFSQQQRNSMDRVRKHGEISVDGVSEEPAPSVLNGFVKRSDGKTMIWIDGDARYGVEGETTRRLQPSDVGGSADRIKVLSYIAPTSAPRSNALRVNKVPLRKGMRKRPATTR